MRDKSKNREIYLLNTKKVISSNHQKLSSLNFENNYFLKANKKSKKIPKTYSSINSKRLSISKKNENSEIIVKKKIENCKTHENEYDKELKDISDKIFLLKMKQKEILKKRQIQEKEKTFVQIENKELKKTDKTNNFTKSYYQQKKIKETVNKLEKFKYITYDAKKNLNQRKTIEDKNLKKEIENEKKLNKKFKNEIESEKNTLDNFKLKNTEENLVNFDNVKISINHINKNLKRIEQNFVKKNFQNEKLTLNTKKLKNEIKIEKNKLDNLKLKNSEENVVNLEKEKNEKVDCEKIVVNLEKKKERSISLKFKKILKSQSLNGNRFCEDINFSHTQKNLNKQLSIMNENRLVIIEKKKKPNFFQDYFRINKKIQQQEEEINRNSLSNKSFSVDKKISRNSLSNKKYSLNNIQNFQREYSVNFRNESKPTEFSDNSKSLHREYSAQLAKKTEIDLDDKIKKRNSTLFSQTDSLQFENRKKDFSNLKEKSIKKRTSLSNSREEFQTEFLKKKINEYDEFSEEGSLKSSRNLYKSINFRKKLLKKVNVKKKSRNSSTLKKNKKQFCEQNKTKNFYKICLTESISNFFNKKSLDRNLANLRIIFFNLHKLEELKIRQRNFFYGINLDLNLIEHKNNHKKYLILDLDETLIFTSRKKINPSSIQIGQNFFLNLRPNVINFLKTYSKIFNLILFTASEQTYAEKVLNFIDPKNEFFILKFFRHNCVHLNDIVPLKSLEFLKNLCLKNTLIIDNNPDHFYFNLDNVFPIVPFFGEEHDQELNNLAFFLNFLINQNDFRKVLEENFRLKQMTNFKDFHAFLKHFIS